MTEMAEGGPGSQLKPRGIGLPRKVADSDTGEEMDPHSDGEDSGREDDFVIRLVREMIMNYENGVHLI